MAMSWPEVCGRRLARHGLTATSMPADPAAAAAAMCGAHAQMMSAAEVSIGLRAPGLTRTDVRRALWTDHTLVKTFGPRGTIHLLTAADLGLWCGALGSLPLPGRAAPAIRVTPEQTDELVSAIAAVLTEGELTVDELTEALGARLGAWAVEPVMPAFQTMWPRWRLVTDVAAHRGALCFGPDRGRRVTYTSPARWLPGFAVASPGEGATWLLDRYLWSFGPSTPEHLARWLATSPAWARHLFDAHDLDETSLAGGPAWVSAGDTEPGEPTDELRLLPHFDAFVVGCQPRGLLFPGRAGDRALNRGQAGNFPVVLVGSEVVGVWHQKRSSTRVAITVEPLRTLTARERGQLDEQVERVGAIVEARPDLTIGPIAVGAHA